MARNACSTIAAINVSHDRKESESKRTMKAIAFGQETFLDLVMIDGTLTLKNFAKRAVRGIVTRVHGVAAPACGFRRTGTCTSHHGCRNGAPGPL